MGVVSGKQVVLCVCVCVLSMCLSECMNVSKIGDIWQSHCYTVTVSFPLFNGHILFLNKDLLHECITTENYHRFHSRRHYTLKSASAKVRISTDELKSGKHYMQNKNSQSLQLLFFHVCLLNYSIYKQ